jgi:23S rRNA (adenine2030-N6)-methyltransferase
MLSYQHSYHAGCFADVIKHIGLCTILAYATQKEKPLFYLDTHAGRGLYDLNDKHAMKNQEFLLGISALWSEKNHLPSEFTPYLNAIAHWNPDGHLRYYPGSPAFALQMLRRQDRLYLCEKHPGEFEHLQTFFKHSARVHCADTDGYKALNACLPPLEHRGVIMIDPSYEIKDEYRLVPQAIQAALRLFATGIYCVWYPIIDRKLRSQLLQGMTKVAQHRSLCAEFYLNSQPPLGMDGCGLYIINPPFTLEAQLRIQFDRLLTILNPGRSSYVLKATGT